MKNNYFLGAIFTCFIITFCIIGCASGPVETKTIALDLIGTTWTEIDLRHNSLLSSEDWQFNENGVLISLGYDHNERKDNNSWVQNNNFVIITYNDNYVTYKLEILNYNLMKGTGMNIYGIEWPVELRRK